MKKGEIKAVHDDDLITFLKSLDLYDGVIKGFYKCAICGSIITLDNIQGVSSEDKEIKFYCTDYSCYELLIKRGV